MSILCTRNITFGYILLSMRYLIFSLVLALVYSCVPPTEQNDLDISVDLQQENQKAILDAKDQRDAKTLMSFLDSKSATERFLASEAGSSVINDSLAQKLSSLLVNDASEDVRLMAAYAIGQQQNPSYLDILISAFTQQDTSRYNSPVRGAILEAIGKCGDQKTLELISSVKTYKNTDDHLILGQARSIYRFGRRGIFSDVGTKVMIDRILDEATPESTRVMAAQYLNRNSDLEISDAQFRLGVQLSKEKSPAVRMALASTLTRLGNIEMLPSLLSMVQHDTDYRVQCNILRQLQSYDYTAFRDTVVNLLATDNHHVFNLTTDLLKNTAVRTDAQYYTDRAELEVDLYKKAKIYAIALNSMPTGYINTRRSISSKLTEGLTVATADVDKVEYLKALSLDPLNIGVLIDQGLSSNSNLVRTKSIESIPTLLTNERTRTVFRSPSAFAGFREALVVKLGELIGEGDSGTIAAISTLLRNEECGFKDVVGLNLKLRSAMRQLKIPEEYEAKKECLETLGYLEDTTYYLEPLSFNHPIDWEAIAEINDSSKAYIITTAGQIEVQLFKTHATGSVANFVSLAASNYYDAKTIHRVVPNFVIQGGCSRGDGYGGLDYSIRSELGPKYYDDDGYIGMASAGLDTEGTQWFITHSPTPHLDGSYTIFGKVTSGMDVVHSIKEGDLIQDVRILKY